MKPKRRVVPADQHAAHADGPAGQARDHGRCRRAGRARRSGRGRRCGTGARGRGRSAAAPAPSLDALGGRPVALEVDLGRASCWRTR